MPLTQIQIIQSLGEAMSWFERELGWGVPASELRHLSGRIGELYAALITGGQMAPEVNKRGYDVVAHDGQRVSVKTTTAMTSGGGVNFNPNTLDQVDRIVILRINTDEMQIDTLLDDTVQSAMTLMTDPKNGKRTIALSKLLGRRPPRENIPVADTVEYENLKIEALENGTIQVFKNGEFVTPAKPLLRKVAVQLGLNLLNNNGNEYNTRQLGSIVIRAIQSSKNGE